MDGLFFLFGAALILSIAGIIGAIWMMTRNRGIIRYIKDSKEEALLVSKRSMSSDVSKMEYFLSFRRKDGTVIETKVSQRNYFDATVGWTANVAMKEDQLLHLEWIPRVVFLPDLPWVDQLPFVHSKKKGSSCFASMQLSNLGFSLSSEEALKLDQSEAVGAIQEMFSQSHDFVTFHHEDQFFEVSVSNMDLDITISNRQHQKSYLVPTKEEAAKALKSWWKETIDSASS